MSLPVTLFRGRGHLKVLVENTPGAWGAGTLRLAAVRGLRARGAGFSAGGGRGGPMYLQFHQPLPTLLKSILRGWPGTRLVG